MRISHINHRFDQAEAAMRRSQSPLGGETLVQLAARMRSAEYQKAAQRKAMRMTRISQRCARLVAENKND